MNLPSINNNSIVHVTMICIVLVRHISTFGSPFMPTIFCMNQILLPSKDSFRIEIVWCALNTFTHSMFNRILSQ